MALKVSANSPITYVSRSSRTSSLEKWLKPQSVWWITNISFDPIIFQEPTKDLKGDKISVRGDRRGNVPDCVQSDSSASISISRLLQWPDLLNVSLPDNVSVSFFQPECSVRIDARVHASDNAHLLKRTRRQLRCHLWIVAALYILLVSSEKIVQPSALDGGGLGTHSCLSNKNGVRAPFSLRYSDVTHQDEWRSKNKTE